MRTRRFGSAATAAAALSATTSAALAQTGGSPAAGFPFYHGPGMMWGGGPWGGFGMVLGPVFMIVVLVAAVAATVYLVRALGRGGGSRGPAGDDASALSILKERFARGEIDAKEFEERRRLLVG